MQQRRSLEALPAPSAAHGKRDSEASTHHGDHPWRPLAWEGKLFLGLLRSSAGMHHRSWQCGSRLGLMLSTVNSDAPNPKLLSSWRSH